MALQQLTLPGEVVKKRNELVRSKINVSNVLGSRILANLIACVRHDDAKFQEVYRVTIKDFIADESGRGYTAMKGMCKELASATAELETVDAEGEKVLSLYPFFSSIKYRKGVIEAQFNVGMSPLLLQLRECFTQYNLMEYLTLPSIYSQRLFEILKSWAKTPSGEVVLSVAELHRLLDTPPSFRSDFKSFRVRVIEKAHKDITTKTSLRFEWEQVKSGRSVEGIRFFFGPGRRAIAEQEAAKLKEKKRIRLQNQRILTALDCAKKKAGKCQTMDNKPIVCKLCREMDLCEEMRRKNATS